MFLNCTTVRFRMYYFYEQLCDLIDRIRFRFFLFIRSAVAGSRLGESFFKDILQLFCYLSGCNRCFGYQRYCKTCTCFMLSVNLSGDNRRANKHVLLFVSVQSRSHLRTTQNLWKRCDDQSRSLGPSQSHTFYHPSSSLYRSGYWPWSSRSLTSFDGLSSGSKRTRQMVGNVWLHGHELHARWNSVV
jgi:hypothetical protein